MPEPSADIAALKTRLGELARERIAAAYTETQKQVRQEKVGAAKKAATEALIAEGLDADKAKPLFKELEADVVRNAILDTGKRIDGRDTRTVRQIIGEVGILPRAHGSALFTRGETQALCVATLGTGQDEQVIDALEGERREHFMLHYNFPPTASVRPAAWARRVVARSATVSSPIAPCVPCCRKRACSPTRCALSAR